MKKVQRLTAAALLLASTSLAAFAQGDGVDIYLIGGKADDTFWAAVKAGMEDAGLAVQAAGGSVNYLALQSYEKLGADAAELTRTAIANEADAIIVSDWQPDAQDESIKEAIAKGIKVMLVSAGSTEKVEELGAVNWIGVDDTLSGKAAGAYFVEQGAKHVVCVNTLPGSVSLEARCDGVVAGATEAGSQAEHMRLPAASFGDAVALSEAIRSTIAKDPSIDAFVTIGATDGVAVALGVETAGGAGTVKVGTFDMNTTVLDHIKSGKILFAVDQQPYLMGYLATAFLQQNIQYGIDLPMKPVFTGPGIVNAENVDAAIAGAAAGRR